MSPYLRSAALALTGNLSFLVLIVTVSPVTLLAQQPANETTNPSEKGSSEVPAEPDPDERPAESISTRLMRTLNVPLKTAGGAQLWTDHLWRDGYRMQQHALTGHWRLIDPNDVRKAFGTREHCERSLDQLSPPVSVAADSPTRVVVLLHGLMRTHHSMKPLADDLQEAGYSQLILVSYASTRTSITEHAAALREILDGFPPQTRFSFAGHSMGNIVVRRMVGELQSDGDPTHLLPRCEAMVMLGPPNQGAAIAKRLAKTGVFGWVTGKGGLELGPQWDEFVKKVAVPPFPFAIIAGDLSDSSIQNPLLDGEGDFVVSVEEARLEGAAEFHRVPALHSFLMSDPTAMQLTVDFLKSHAPPTDGSR